MRRAGTLVAPLVLALGIFAATASAGGSPVKIVKATGSSVPGPSSQSVECPGHNQVLGGGFAAADDGALMQKTKPTGLFGWKVEGLFIAGTPGDFTTYAVCNTAADRHLMRVKEKVTASSPATPGDTVEQGVSAKCPSGWQVISGGYQVKPRFDGGGTDGELGVDTSMAKDARTWFVHGGNDGAPTDLVAYALCEKRDRTSISQDQRSVISTTGGEAVSTTATCDRGAHVVGGGFRVKPDEAGGVFPIVSTSAPTGTGAWKSTFTPESNLGGKLTSYAECES